jgi:hypothetical protein
MTVVDAATAMPVGYGSAGRFQRTPKPRSDLHRVLRAVCRFAKTRTSLTLTLAVNADYVFSRLTTVNVVSLSDARYGKGGGNF